MLDEAERRYKARETLNRIADDLGVNRQRLADRLRKRGVSIRGKGPSAAQVLEIVRRYEQGESLVTVGARVGFDAGTVRTHLQRAGVLLRDTHGRERLTVTLANASDQSSIAKATAGPWSAAAGMKPYRPSSTRFVKRMSRASGPSGSSGSVFSMMMT